MFTLYNDFFFLSISVDKSDEQVLSKKMENQLSVTVAVIQSGFGQILARHLPLPRLLFYLFTK